MKNEMKTLRETNTHGGCTVSVMSVKYPLNEKYEKLNAFFASLAEKYADFVKIVCFDDDIKRFDEYRKQGGRRSKFPKREYFFSVTEVKTEREGYKTFKTEAFCTDGGKIIDYSLDYKTWRVPEQTVCILHELTPNRPKERFDGFYLCNRETVFYKVIPIWREKECTARQITSFEARVQVKARQKHKKSKLLHKNV